ncbi:MAG: acetylornithine deacetylase [Tateyamaria sp.]|jgi:acetylornithine deacetylase|uniref:acetylornithine deacetylase n=1 Tax=Tateyamaria sp. TaxID=1929288 RepID=UPI0032DC54A4
MQTTDLLRDLIAFPTVSADPNLDLIQYCETLLRDVGAQVELIKDPSGQKANLYATIGPLDRPGVLLSGHTDVVPVVGQDWTVPPFEMTERDGLLFGRGCADMKGFVASAMAAALRAATLDLKTPLHLALSYDEEIGCVGVRSLIDMLAAAPIRPRFCIVGEPTSMQVATGHKGKTAARLVATGREGHSALAPSALNAIHMACDIISFIRDLQEKLAAAGARDPAYDVPYTTLHVGMIEGGTALNIVPNRSEFLFEIRNLIEDDPQQLLAQIRDHAASYVQGLRKNFPQADISIDVTNTYPPLNTDPDSDVVQLVQGLSGHDTTLKVAFGTEGGLFSSRLEVPTVVCGPGSMAQGHKPDEYVSVAQLEACDEMMDTLLQRLVVGL